MTSTEQRAERMKEAARLYRTGLSTRDIALTMGIGKTTAHQLLVDGDVVMRDASIAERDMEWELYRLRIIEEAREKHKAAMELQRKLERDSYDSQARRTAKDDVRRAMKQSGEVPAHFGYRNVFGSQAVGVML